MLRHATTDLESLDNEQAVSQVEAFQRVAASVQVNELLKTDTK